MKTTQDRFECQLISLTLIQAWKDLGLRAKASFQLYCSHPVVKTTQDRVSWLRLLLLLHHQFLLLHYRPRLLHFHMHLQRVSLIAQSQRRTLHSSWSLHAPRHPIRLLLFLLRILSFLALDAKGGERVDLGGVLREGFVFSLCATFMHHVYIPALVFCDMCPYEILESYVDYLVLLISCHLFGSSS
jgi:hypothetical protein